jgi:hypothetical protein
MPVTVAKAGFFGWAALALVGCGSRLAQVDGGGDAGAPHAGAPDVDDGGASGGGASSGSASGAGSAGETTTGGSDSVSVPFNDLGVPSFQRIAPELPADLQSRVPPGSAVRRSVTTPRISIDGASVVVAVDFRWGAPEGDTAGGAGRPFRWTAQAGTEMLPVPWVDVVSGDGEAVFSKLAEYEVPPNLFRWTEQGGSVDLISAELFAEYPYGVDFGPSEGPFASRTGQSIVARGTNDTGWHSLLWEAQAGWQTLGSYGDQAISADGDVVVVNETHVWSTARGVEALPETCETAVFSSESGVLIAACRQAPEAVADKVLQLLPDGSQRDLSGAGEPMSVSSDGSVVLFTDDHVGSVRGAINLRRFRPTTLWSQATGMVSLSELDGSERLLGLSDSGVVALLNDVDELEPGVFDTVVSSIPLRWSLESGRQDLPLPTGYEHGNVTAYNGDASLVAGFVFNGSYLGPTTTYGEGVPSRPGKSMGTVTVWDEQGPRVLAEELFGLIEDPRDLEGGRPLFVRRTDRAILVIGTGQIPQSPPFQPDTTVWVAALPLR